jgi:hypothetical protein
MRLSWQATPKNKIDAHGTRRSTTTSAGCSPESSQHCVSEEPGANITLTAPLTIGCCSKTARGHPRGGYSHRRPIERSFRTLIAVTEQGGVIPGLRYRGKGVANDTGTATFDTIVTPNMLETKASLSYVTGSHAFKVGFGNLRGDQTGASFDIPSELSYRFNNGVPNQLQQRGTVYRDSPGASGRSWACTRDKWTLKRLTLTPGVRFDYMSSGFRDFHLGPVLSSRLEISRSPSPPGTTSRTCRRGSGLPMMCLAQGRPPSR